jgi:thiamine-monophosphate kinase
LSRAKSNPKPTEIELIRMFNRTINRGKKPIGGLVIGPGDDAAVIRGGADRDLVMTTDGLVEGVHFRRDWLTGRELGWRLAAVNLSDVAAMGGRPLYALLSLVLPPDLGIDYVKAIERGAADHLHKFGAAIIGGNVSGSKRDLMCDLTLIGECRRSKAWRRQCRGGRDKIVVAGWLGSARAGLALLKRRPARPGYESLIRAYKKPVPRLDVADLLRNDPSIHGAIDVSDGLSTDLIQLCRAGGAGCEIELPALPVQPALRRYCLAEKKDSAEWALSGGDDYALILSVDGRRADTIAGRLEAGLNIPARVIGRFTRHPGRYGLLEAGGKRRRFKAGGWDHLSD